MTRFYQTRTPTGGMASGSFAPFAGLESVTAVFPRDRKRHEFNEVGIRPLRLSCRNGQRSASSRSGCAYPEDGSPVSLLRGSRALQPRPCHRVLSANRSDVLSKHALMIIQGFRS